MAGPMGKLNWLWDLWGWRKMEEQLLNAAIYEEDDLCKREIGIPQVKLGISDQSSSKAEIEDDKDVERIASSGKVTALDPDTNVCIIDQKYKCYLANFDVKLDRGSAVEFEVVRSRKDPQWTVASIKLCESDKAKTYKERMRHRVEIAKITGVYDNHIEVVCGNPKTKSKSKTIRIPNDPKLNAGFLWMAGDWIEFHVENKGEIHHEAADDDFDLPEELISGKVLSITPLQRRNVVGKVTSRSGRLMIDDDILFTSAVCKSKLSVGDVVKCEAILSSLISGNYNNEIRWRAISVEKSNFLRYTGATSSNSEWSWDQDDAARDTVNMHEELTRDKFGIRIYPRFINFPALFIGSTSQKTFTITNSSAATVCLRKFYFPQDHSVCKFEIRCARQQDDGTVTFQPHEEIPFEVSCTPLMIGKTNEMCVFDFDCCLIARTFSVVGRSEAEDALRLKETGAKSAVRKPVDISKVMSDRDRRRIRGSHTTRAPFFSQKRLPGYGVPRSLYQILNDQDDNRLQTEYPGVLNPLDFENYKRKFKVALWFEEIHNELRRREYDLNGVCLQVCCTHPVKYKFVAPGIQEFSPPVLLQDTIEVFDSESDGHARFQGTIDKIVDCEVTCIFGEVFDQQYTGFPLTIQFKLGRTNYKRCHFAVETAVDYLGESMLFPQDEIVSQPPRITVYEVEDDDFEKEKVPIGIAKEVPPTQKSVSTTPSVFIKQKPVATPKANGTPLSTDGPGTIFEAAGRRVRSARSNFSSDTASEPSCSTARLTWFNKSLNEEQKVAVRRILRGQARPIPYIIFGPPGTGKTVTMVEAIMQVNKLDRNSRILVCGPSNASADLIAEYLANSNEYYPGDFIRLNGFLRAGQTMLESIAPYCTDGEDIQSVAMHRLVICTTVTAGQFFPLDLQIGHFTHVFIDEAGYCTEPEALVPTTLLALSKGGQLILAGDPKQLGPVLMSDVAKKVALSGSLLERLMSLKLYSRDPERFPKEKYNPLVLTKLVKNYRAHPALLKLPSRLFYDDDLEAMGPYEKTQALCQDPEMRELLVSEGVPLIVHGVNRRCQRDGDSKSSYNNAEAVQVVQYVLHLIQKLKISHEDIGIITPYRKQVDKIRQALQLNLELDDDCLPKVASVEEFQGGERKVIIISTVRSVDEDKVEMEMDKLGFLYQPKRFNVAITRAMALLIVIGNPHVWARSEHWLQLLRYALELKAYKGCNIPVQLDTKIKNLCELKDEETNGYHDEIDGNLEFEDEGIEGEEEGVVEDTIEF